MTLHHFGAVIFGAVMTAIVSATEFIMDAIAATTYINPEVKQFLIDIYPFISALIGLFTLILLMYRIKKTRKEIKKLDEK